MRHLAAVLVVGLVGLATWRPSAAPSAPPAAEWRWLPAAVDSFVHPQHAALYPTCVTCHAGATDAGAALWPDATGCAACHDGTVEARVNWVARATPRSDASIAMHERGRRGWRSSWPWCRAVSNATG